MMECSVILCTHNPRREYLRRAIEALQTQTLSTDRWELLLVDNASEEPVAQVFDLSWHPHGRCVREDTLGLTSARVRGIRESVGELLVFVDDDNVLDGDYLLQALTVAKEFPQMGAWCGSIRGEFKIPLPDWYRSRLDHIAVHELSCDVWSNCNPRPPVIPCGAGMCVRRAIAEDYLQKCDRDPRRLALDRRGANLSSGGDHDLALCAMDLGYGIGRFARLRLTHLIAKERLSREYLVKLAAAQQYSEELLSRLRKSSSQERHLSVRRFARWLRAIRLRGLDRQIALACWKARIAAEDECRKMAADQEAVREGM